MGPQQHVIQSDPHVNSIKSKSSDAQLLCTVTMRNRSENRKFSLLIGWDGTRGGSHIAAMQRRHAPILTAEASDTDLSELGQASIGPHQCPLPQPDYSGMQVMFKNSLKIYKCVASLRQPCKVRPVLCLPDSDWMHLP